MISRVADHCFWLGRYLERAENTARVLEVNQTLLLDFAVPLEQQWQPLCIISGIHDMPEDADGETVQNHLTWESDNHASIVSSIAAARENARNIREVISAESWERLNYYYLWMQSSQARALYHSDRNAFYSEIKHINQLITGISEGTMSHGEAWEFIQLGKYLERAGQTARILDVKYHILLPTVDQHRHARRQCALGGDPDELLGLRAVPQAASRLGSRHRGRRFPDLRLDLSPLGTVLPGQVPRGGLRDLGPARQGGRAMRWSGLSTIW